MAQTGELERWKNSTLLSAGTGLTEGGTTPHPSGLLKDLLGASVKHNNAPGIDALTAELRVANTDLTALRTKLAKLESENLSLKSEKATWLSRLQLDNHKLGQMFQDFDETKRRLVQEIDNIQLEKARLKSLERSVSEEALDRLVQKSCLAPGARKLLPVEKRAEAADIYDKLVKLVTQCRDNQVEVLQCVKEHAEKVESGFQEGTNEGKKKRESAMKALESIASTLPGNQLAAEAVALSLSDAMVCALMEKSSVLLADRAKALTGAGLELDDQQNVLSGRATRHTQPQDVKTLQTQVDSLQKALQEMRKRNTQLIAKANESSKATTSGVGGGGKEPKANAASPRSKITSADHSHSSNDYSMVGVNTRLADRDFNDLPESTRQLMSKMIALHVSQSLKENPMSIGLKDDILKETAAEVASQVSGLVGSALKALRIQDDIDIQNTRSLESAVFKILSSPLLFQEILGHTTLTLTYLASRFGIQGAQSNLTKPFSSTVRNSIMSPQPGSDLSNQMEDKSEYYDQHHQTPPRKSLGYADVSKPKSNATVGETESQFTLRPPEAKISPAKPLPSFMQPKPTKRK